MKTSRSRPSPQPSSSSSASNRTASPATNTSPDRIASRAYELWETEGREHGNDQDHWLRAERELADRDESGREAEDENRDVSVSFGEGDEANAERTGAGRTDAD